MRAVPAADEGWSAIAVLTYLYRYLPVQSVIGFVWSKRFTVYVAAGTVFPDVFRNLYLAGRRVDPEFLWDAVIAAGTAVGGSVHKFVTGLQVFQGKVSVGEALELFYAELPELVQSVVGWHPSVLGTVLVLSAVATPVVFYRFWERAILWLSSTTPAIEHYALLTALYIVLVVLYSVLNGLGPEYIFSVQEELVAVVDQWAAPAVNESAVNVTG